MESLRTTLLQSNLFWENKLANLSHFEKQIAEINEPTDIIILPEMFTTGFSMQPHLWAESVEDDTVNWMRDIAQTKNAVITGSIIIKEGEAYYNRLIWMCPDGTYSTYDKRHLFSLAGEENYYSAGKQKLIVELKGWKICPLVCYDLRFPVWSRNDQEIDLYIYVANWPERRRYAWSQLLIARAIENQSFVVGVNRVGDDGNGIAHSGDSVAIDPLGEIISSIQPHEEEQQTISLSKEHLCFVRDKFRFLNDRDDFTIQVE